MDFRAKIITGNGSHRYRELLWEFITDVIGSVFFTIFLIWFVDMSMGFVIGTVIFFIIIDIIMGIIFWAFYRKQALTSINVYENGIDGIALASFFTATAFAIKNENIHSVVVKHNKIIIHAHTKLTVHTKEADQIAQIIQTNKNKPTPAI